MKIHNIRLGHACNSSSTHSVVIVPKGTKLHRDDSDGQEFGWDNFHLSDRESKLAYLGQQIKQNLESVLGEEIAALTASQIVGVEIDPEGYVDHRSKWTFPRPIGRKTNILDMDYLRGIMRFLERKDVVITGGNDNSDGYYPYGGKHVASVRTGAMSLNCGDYWLLYNPINGAKARISLDDMSDVAVTKSKVPELVDLKITDYCEANCNFCYQGSSEKGKHAFYRDIESIAWELSCKKVLEVAIGGGEPTLHPKFVSIIGSFYHGGVTPNFTTKRTDWLRMPWADEILDRIGSVAFSVQYGNDIRQLRDLFLECGLRKYLSKVSIQCVDGVVYDMAQIIQQCYRNSFPLTILGFKTCGRGAKYKRLDSKVWKVIADASAKYEIPRIGVDTAMVNQYPDELAKYPRILHTPAEGKFSCYIDAVTKTMAASSYSGDAVPWDAKTWLDEYAKY